VATGGYEAPFWAQNGSVYAEMRMKLFLQRIETEVCEESCPLRFPLRPPVKLSAGAVPLPSPGLGLSPLMKKQALGSGSGEAPRNMMPDRSIRHRAERDGAVVGAWYEVPIGTGGYAKIRRQPAKR
jgi:hypothetical protein